MLIEVNWRWRECDQVLPSSQADPSATLDRSVPSQHPPLNSTTEVPQDMHSSIQWIHGPLFLRVTPGKWQLKKFSNNSSTRPCCQGKFSWTFTPTPFMQFLSLSLQDLLIKISLAQPKLVFHHRGQKELSVEAICFSEHASFLQSRPASGQPSLDCFTEQWTLSRHSAQCPQQDGHQRLG